jgi:TM2 domain-containing membrane protein YozV
MDPQEVAAMSPSSNPNPLLERRRKHPFLAGIFSLMPGLGQVYVGYYRRGFVHALVIASCITLLSSGAVEGLEPFLGFFVAFFWLYNIIDSVRLANLYNDAVAGLGPEDLRQELVLVGRRGSLIGGALMILVSFVILLHTRFEMPLEWLEDWWPAIPLGFGVYLLVQAIRDRRS